MVEEYGRDFQDEGGDKAEMSAMRSWRVCAGKEEGRGDDRVSTLDSGG